LLSGGSDGGKCPGDEQDCELFFHDISLRAED
jgi:hypothetical protein